MSGPGCVGIVAELPEHGQEQEATVERGDDHVTLRAEWVHGRRVIVWVTHRQGGEIVGCGPSLMVDGALLADCMDLLLDDPLSGRWHNVLGDTNPALPPQPARTVVDDYTDVCERERGDGE